MYVYTGKAVGPPAASPWLRVVPPGIRYNLRYIAHRYASAKPTYKGRGPPIYITENGIGTCLYLSTIFYLSAVLTFNLSMVTTYQSSSLLC